MQAAVDWLEAEGGSCRLSFAGEGEARGTGALAAGDLAAGEAALVVPLRLTMSAASIDAAGPLAPVAAAELPGDEALALLLLFERARGDESAWAPYLRTLPAAYDTPLFWSDEELAELEGTMVLTLTRAMQAQLEQDWAEMHAPLVARVPGFEPSFDDYRWAMTTIWTRAFAFTLDGEYRRVLLPLVDLLNHDPSAGATTDDLVSFDAAREALVFAPQAAVAAGAPVFNCYGPYTNAKLLFTYGFVVPGNPYRALDIWFNVRPDDPLAPLKRSALANNPLTAAGQTYDFTGTIHDGGAVDARLLATLRMIMLQQDELPHIANAFVPTERVSDRNEAAAIGALRASCATKLARFATSLEDDVELLVRGGLSARQAAAIRVRMEDKEVLSEWAEGA